MPTLSEKIFEKHCIEGEAKAGNFIRAKLDLVMGEDVTIPLALNKFKELGFEKVFAKGKVIFVLDHFLPTNTVDSAKTHNKIRKFAKKYDIKNLYDQHNMGIEHALLPEQGHIYPGQLVIGADSHTCTYGALGAFATGIGSTDMAVGLGTGELWFKVPETIKFNYKGKLPEWVSGKDLILYTIGDIGADGATYKAMEFGGEVIKNLPMADRFTMSNMAIEAGGKAGLIEVDEKTINYLEEKVKREYEIYKSDKDANFEKEIEYDVSDMEPQVAFPYSPENTKAISEIKESIKIDEAIIGSCTNGRLEDLRRAAKVLKGKKINKEVRLIIIPATRHIYKEAMKEGLLKIFIDAGAGVSMPTCGPCFGGHTGVLGPGEVAITSTNRNFKGRLGSPDSKAFLANPSVVAASAIAGKIVHPEEVIS
ncbi:3-isopropylmalate dehydratase large subunit [Halanaerobium sp. DL-01]|uniref:3-isopropylmalate dehydratase large subunit n=1 Tax=Halanaerobium sp. DL-01 TaxID=1653064 RepID=UPI000DF4AB3F|nr:3-isopropylmalate dehydratase large subunit [Halanaerobium sp. DL-01]RCW78131.1 3-isopropylmalate dehydratase large subunit [Halanaerobium sp. DL-01]